MIDPQFGARPLKRALQRLIQDPLAMKILDGEVLPGDTVVVDCDPKKGGMRFDRGTAKVGRGYRVAQPRLAGAAGSGFFAIK